MYKQRNVSIQENDHISRERCVSIVTLITLYYSFSWNWWWKVWKNCWRPWFEMKAHWTYRFSACVSKLPSLYNDVDVGIVPITCRFHYICFGLLSYIIQNHLIIFMFQFFYLIIPFPNWISDPLHRIGQSARNSSS